MKKHNLFIASLAVVAALFVGSAGAAPIRGGGHHHAPRPFVTHTHGAPRHGGHHHNVVQVVTPVPVVSHHHHHHHHARAGNIILATALLISAFM
ncbi:MAG: hypothetical protein J6Y07_03055 [Alphaproteobacteria bacterium]|nr:hypothetical protein [Alphaproteobacteria bacterium]